MRRAQAHFVECGGEWSRPGTPGSPPTQFRDEAYAWSNNVDVIFLDPDHDLSSYEDLPGAASTCSSVVADSDGNVYALYVGGSGRITKFDTDLNQDWTTFVPDAGWGTAGGTLRLSSDESYLYAMLGSPRQLYKFNISDGSEEWQTVSTNGRLKDRFCLFIDQDDNAYVEADGYTQSYDSSGSFIREKQTGEYQRCIWQDYSTDRLYIAGADLSGGNYYHLYAINWDGTGLNRFSIGGVSETLWNFIKEGDYIYAVGTRTNTWDGATGYASIWKLSTTLSVIATYDTGFTSYGIMLDHNGNLAIYSGHYEGGDGSAGIWILDTDLTYISNHNVATDQSGADGAEGVKFPYHTGSGPGGTGAVGITSMAYLEGETVGILADGVVYPDQVVTNGTIDTSAFADAMEVHWGLKYYSKLKPMKPLSQPDMMKKKATCKQMGISVHNTDDSNDRSEYIADSGVLYGVHDDDMKQIDFNDPQWKNKCDIDGLFTGTVAVHVPDGFGVNMPLQIMTNSPLPCVVRAMIPKVDVTGT